MESHIFPIQTFVTFVLFSPSTANHYNLLVPTNACTILIILYISPHLAATCFGRSPSSGSSQPDSLKLTAVNQTLRCFTCICTYLLTPCSRVLLKKLTDFAANQEIPRILWNNPTVHYRTHKRPL
jgi:hypothetical protein